MNIINQAITGQEKSEDTSSPLNVMINFYMAFNNKNYEFMEQNWLQSDEASMSNPLGGIKRGWNEIKEVYK